MPEAELDESKWRMIEAVITGQLVRTKKAQRTWTILLVVFVLGFVGACAAAFVEVAAANVPSGPGDLYSRAQQFLAIAPLGVAGFHAMKMMGRAENKIDPLEVALVYIKGRNREWKLYWHRANASDEGKGSIMDMLENF
jgi:hypothetical protein